VGSGEFVRFFMEEFPDQSLKEIIEHLVHKNLNELDVDLRQRYLSERKAWVIQHRRFMPMPETVPNHPIGALKPEGITPSLVPPQSESSLQEKDEAKPTQTEEDGRLAHKLSLSPEFFQYLQEHPKAFLSIPEIHRAALLSILTDTTGGIGLPGFSWYFAEKQQEILKIKKERENAVWYEKKWPFGSSSVEEKRDEMLNHLYAMTEISQKIGSHPSHITGLDMKYLLLNAHLVEKIMDIYDFNKNGFVERKELESLYCLFNSLKLFPVERNSSAAESWFDRQMPDVTAKNIFNYILKYQEIPSKDDWTDSETIHFGWVSFTGGVEDDEISLSREDMVKLVSVLFRKFFHEKYFTNKVSSETPPVDEESL
ncbi:MAG: hypothetical protein OXB86_00740, partial [Bdellovibrionales bacterium]|nr:hypothetical protein [Bdellovibrionales bacterium]